MLRTIEKKKFKIIDHKVPNYRSGNLDILSLYKRFPNNKKGVTIAKTKQNFYINLKEKYPHLSKYTNRQILDCVTTFNKFVAKTTTTYKDGVFLPANMGILMMCTFGKRTLAINVQASEKTGYEQFYRNEHSEGNGCGVYYSTTQPKGETGIPTPMYVNSKYWSIKPGMFYRYAMCDAYKDNWKKFYTVPNSRRYVDMQNESYKKDIKLKKAIKEIKNSYDEFDMGFDNDEDEQDSIED